MKSFLRRLKFYGIGFGIGLVFVFFFFQNRGCTWLPSNRVKNSILDRVIVVSKQHEAALLKHGISKDEVIGFLNDGDVEFGRSKKKGNPQVYSLTSELDGKTVELWFTLPANSFISEVQWPAGKVYYAGNTTQGTGEMIHFPNVRSLVFLGDDKYFLCQQDKLGLISTQVIFERLKKTGHIDFGKSRLNATPKAQHYIWFTTAPGKQVASETVWKKGHIEMSRFILADSLNCP